MKSVAQTQVSLCKVGLWGRVAIIMKAQNPFRNRSKWVNRDWVVSAPGKNFGDWDNVTTTYGLCGEPEKGN